MGFTYFISARRNSGSGGRAVCDQVNSPNHIFFQTAFAKDIHSPTGIANLLQSQLVYIKNSADF